MARYTVELMQQVYESVTVTVEADSKDEAERKALDMSDLNWRYDGEVPDTRSAHAMKE